jgi:hypothetical protein
MSSNELSYNLLPADRFANTNFRHLFLTLGFLEALLTSCNATLCMLLSIYIYTRQPFILLHTSFHPFIQASIFLIASVAQYIKLLTLFFCIIKIILDDGEIFTACAQVELRPSLEMIQVEKSPNHIARKCFKSRQRYVKNLRSVVRLYPLIQLLCGSLSLAFWCTSDERHTVSLYSLANQPNVADILHPTIQVTPVYYRLLQQTQGPSNIIFVCYLTTWCIDLVLTPLFCLITTWHYARVDWQIQLLAAQETMDYHLSFPNRGRRRDRDGEHSSKGRRTTRATTAAPKKKKKSRKARIKAVLSPFSPSKLVKVDEERPPQREEKIPDVHTMQAPLSVPVSPSTSSSSSSDEHEVGSYPSSHDIYESSICVSMTSTRRQHRLGQRLMQMTASISSRRASIDLPSMAKIPPPSASQQQRRSTISAYLNVEGADEVVDVTCDSLLRQDESDSFRICIQADDTARSVRSQ